jgi:hypothetical protein
MIPLSELGKAGPLSTKTFATGVYPPGRAPYIPIAEAIVPTPERYAVAVTNPAEKTVFYYMEGMTAPSGNFRNYGHDPMAAMVVDRSLRERKPGVYSARVRMPLSGTYDLAFFLESPRIVHCFDVSVKPNPRFTKSAAKGLRLEYLSPGPTVAAGVTTPLRIRITDRATNAPVTDLLDVVVQYSLASGSWSRRETATHAGEGVYEAPLFLSQPGVYYVHVECPSRKTHMRDLPFLSVEATGNAQGDRIPPGRKRGK